MVNKKFIFLIFIGLVFIFVLNEFVNGQTCEWKPTGDYGTCDQLLGVYFDGEKCVYLSGCSGGLEGEIIFNSETACKEVCSRTSWTSDSQGQNIISQTAPNPTQPVYLVIKNSPGVSNWKFEIYEKDSGNPDDDIRVGINALSGIVSGNKIIAEWTITQADINKAKPFLGVENVYEFYFIAAGNSYAYTSPILNVEWITQGQQLPTPTQPTQACSDDLDCSQGQECTWGVCVTPTPLPDICSQYTICSNYPSKTDCTENSCQLNSQTPTSTCPSDATSCGCSWNSVTTSCGPSFISVNINGVSLGTCTFQETEISNCETSNFLEYETTAVWSGNPSIADENGCTSGTIGPIICSAKTKLPMENKYGILLTIISIIGIYFLFFRRKKKK